MISLNTTKIDALQILVLIKLISSSIKKITYLEKNKMLEEHFSTYFRQKVLDIHMHTLYIIIKFMQECRILIVILASRLISDKERTAQEFQPNDSRPPHSPSPVNQSRKFFDEN